MIVQISDDTISLLLSNKTTVDFWFFELGKADKLIKGQLSIDHQFMDSFFEKGKEIWEKSKFALASVLCKRGTNQPNEIVNQITSGALKDVIETLVTIHNVEVGLAIPLMGVALKKGISNLCADISAET